MLTSLSRSLIAKTGSQMAQGKKLFSQVKKPNLIKTGNAKEVFLDTDKFQATGSYLIYNAKDLLKSRLVFLGALGLGSFHMYSYFFGADQEFDEAANLLFSTMGILTVSWISWRTRKTLKSMEIMPDGKTFLLKKHCWFGFKEESYRFNHAGMKGVGYWMNKKMRMPMLRVRDDYSTKLDVRIY